MRSRRSLRQLLVAVLLGVMVGGGLMAVTPAGAEVSQSLATSWKKIWKKELKPLADKRYYTKAKSDSTYATKAESAAAAAAAQSAATSAASSATDSKLGGYYKKTESDARYAPYPSVIRGTYALGGTATGASQPFADSIGWGFTLASPPTVHYINSGAVPPAGCSGTVTAPDASPGHLCVFESFGSNVTTRNIDNASGVHPQASSFGANIWAYSTGAGSVYVYGSFALRPEAPLSTGRVEPTPPHGLSAATGR